jgi:hypothetical protein
MPPERMRSLPDNLRYNNRLACYYYYTSALAPDNSGIFLH